MHTRLFHQPFSKSSLGYTLVTIQCNNSL